MKTLREQMKKFITGMEENITDNSVQLVRSAHGMTDRDLLYGSGMVAGTRATLELLELYLKENLHLEDE